MERSWSSAGTGGFDDDAAANRQDRHEDRHGEAASDGVATVDHRTKSNFEVLAFHRDSYGHRVRTYV